MGMLRFMSLWPFQLYFIPSILPTTLIFSDSVLPVLSLCRTGPFNLMSLKESLLQPWYNPLWLTGLKTPINQLWFCVRHRQVATHTHTQTGGGEGGGVREKGQKRTNQRPKKNDFRYVVGPLADWCCFHFLCGKVSRRRSRRKEGGEGSCTTCHHHVPTKTESGRGWETL